MEKNTRKVTEFKIKKPIALLLDNRFFILK